MDRAKRVADTWQHVPTFRMVAELGSVARASEELGISASSISRKLTSLEQRVGCRLFDRQGKRLVLNSQGTTFLDFVRGAMRGLDDGLSAIAEPAAGETLRIGDATVWSQTVGAQILAEVARSHESSMIRITRVAVDEVARSLLTGVLDVAFVHGFRPKRGIESRRVGRTRFVGVVRADHPLRRHLDRGKLPEALLFAEANRDHRDDFTLVPVELSKLKRIGCSDDAAALALALTTEVAAFVPELLVHRAIEAGELARIQSIDAVSVPFLCVTRAGAAPRLLRALQERIPA